jgi:PleD family two-component response regulator
LDEHISRIWPQAIREAAPLGLLRIDVDHFKACNQPGDQGLKSTPGV